ncbi:MAG: bifunctional diguanylate cyclase/phosphodiesterase [Kiloniellales bacterium]|nr:bifunctional diguanylate cyclase/phosphodiesterase [Kiloniellales bacterium]
MQEPAQRRFESLMGSVVECAFDGIITVREDGAIGTANEAAHAIFGYGGGALIGRPLGEFLPELLAEEEGGTGLRIGLGTWEYEGRRRDGELFPVELSVSEIRRGGTRLMIAILRDVTVRKTQISELQYQATHDALTGLPNRMLLMDRLERAVALAKRENKALGLLLLDLDQFKSINDTLGHKVGDLLLRDVAKRLQEPLRDSDTIARIGGDEFSVLLPTASSQLWAERVAKRITQSFKKPFQVRGLSLEVGVSVGIAMYPRHATGPDALLQCADVAMYQAKEARVGYAVYDQGRDENSVRHLSLSGELRQAIEQGQLTFYYQPKLDLRSGRPCGVEALIRWDHPTLGLVPPDEFVLQAEQTGLIEPLTRWAFDTTLHQLRAWDRKGVRVGLSINLSARNLHDNKLPDRLAWLAQNLSLDRRRICLEITESAIVIDPESALDVVRRLHAHGFRLSIDDFGTGYSSLNYLKRLPVHELKIDKSFVMNMTRNEADAVIVRSTIDLAHNLGLEVVAEGIETEEHQQLLRGLGCDIGQGFFISRPIRSDQTTAWLERSFDHAVDGAGDAGARSAGSGLRQKRLQG